MGPCGVVLMRVRRERKVDPKALGGLPAACQLPPRGYGG